MMDALRGFALLGILTMNIRTFGMLEPAYLNPFYDGELDPLNLGAFTIGQLFFNMKFLSLFSLLFGAGLALQYMSRRGDPGAATRLHLRRMGWLLLFGLLHGYLIWVGDILALYALTGLVLFGLRKKKPKVLLLWSLGLMLVLTLINLLIYGSMQFMSAEDVAGMQQDWRPDAEHTLDIMSHYTGDWLSQVPHRALLFTLMLAGLGLLFAFWKAGAMMLLGMALFKTTVLGGQLPRKIYAIMAAAGLGLGLIVEGLNIGFQFSNGYEPFYSQTLGIAVTCWSSLFMALGYVGLFYLIMPLKALSVVRARLAEVGRMAFTNYILTSIIATLIFNGHGLGLYNQFSYVELAPIVLGIWLVLLIFSWAWLKQQERGPLEKLWRHLTYPKAKAAA